MRQNDEPVKGRQDLEPAEETAHASSGRRTHYSVVVSDDGSATIDGAHVRVAEGEPVHAAILDILHNIAIDLETNVTADISDPATEYTALVEISPDGSSRLLDQEEPHSGDPRAPAEERDEDAEAVAYPGDVPLTEQFEPDPDTWSPDPRATTGRDESNDDFVHHPYDGPDREEPRRLPSVLGLRRHPNSDRKRGPRQSGDEYEAQKLLNKPLVVGPVALLAAAVVIVPLLLLGSGGSDDDRDQRTQAGSSSETRVPGKGGDVPPTVSLSPSTPSGPPSSKASHSPPTTEPPGSSTTRKAPEAPATRKVPPAPSTRKAPETAAAAVKALAKGSSSSRHICYRAYLASQGWQKPVCDGRMTGGPDQNLPIKALNIAMTGVSGSSANAFTYKAGSADGRGEWNQWTSVVGDGKDNYIGSANANAPNMLGFAINIGKGQLCHVARVRNSDGGKQGCVKPRPAFTFGGSLLNKAWLQSVKFTV